LLTGLLPYCATGRDERGDGRADGHPPGGWGGVEVTIERADAVAVGWCMT
jgi:hypothetical protein